MDYNAVIIQGIKNMLLGLARSDHHPILDGAPTNLNAASQRTPSTGGGS